MTTYVYRDGKLVEKSKAGLREGGYVISDEMAETRHMADGKYYTSKKKFRDATRAAGCVEVGDQTHILTKPRKPVELDRRQRREDIQRAIYELKNR
jgi:hypothetical protein